MNEIELLRRRLNNHISLDEDNLTHEEILDISRKLDKMMLGMYTVYGDSITIGD